MSTVASSPANNDPEQQTMARYASAASQAELEMRSGRLVGSLVGDTLTEGSCC